MFFDSIKPFGASSMLSRHAKLKRGTDPSMNGGRIVHYSDEWYTPPELVRCLGEFDLDPCAGPMSHAKENWRLPHDGLSSPWFGRVWCNPPYTLIGHFLARLASHGDGIALVNARVDAAWMQEAMQCADGVLWLKGRIRFLKSADGSRGTAGTIGTALLAYGPHNLKALRKSGLPGITTLVL